MTDYSKKFQPRTRGGYEYEIFAERNGRLFGIFCSCEWSSMSWSTDGSANSAAESKFDLLPIKPEQVEGFAQIYPDKFVVSCSDLPVCGLNMLDHRRITYTPGERLSGDELFEITSQAYQGRCAADCLDNALAAYIEAYKVGRVWDSTEDE